MSKKNPTPGVVIDRQLFLSKVQPHLGKMTLSAFLAEVIAKYLAKRGVTFEPHPNFKPARRKDTTRADRRNGSGFRIPKPPADKGVYRFTLDPNLEAVFRQYADENKIPLSTLTVMAIKEF